MSRRRDDPTYITWQRMKQRCQYQRAPDYPRYGGRGITVCERWQNFENFVADMGQRPGGMQLDRIDNNGHYTPENCRWATKKTNARNRSSNVTVTVDGITKTAIEWGEETGLGEVVSARIARGWSHERAVKTPLATNYRRPRR